MKIYLIRHCESEDDILNCYGGCADFDLTDFGRETAKKASNNLVGLNIQKIFSSPYKRAKNTAKIFGDKIGVDIEIVNDLREHNVHGVMAGVNKDLAKEIFSFWLGQEQYKGYGYSAGKSFYGGEDVKEFDARVKKSFKYVAKQNFETVAVVAHGGVFRSTYKNILGKTEKLVEIEDAAMIEINYVNGKFNLARTKGVKI